MRRQRHSSYRKYQRKESIRARRYLIVALVFVLAAAAAAAVLIVVNHRKSQETVYYSELTDCTLPTLSMMFHGQEINQTFGYTEEMDLQYIRDSIYILDSGYDIDIVADMYGNGLKALSFSVMDVDNHQLIQSSEVTDYKLTDDDRLSATLRIDNMIDQDTEYFIDILLTDANERQIHYYSRLMLNTTSPVLDMMNLVREHHDALYDKSRQEFLVQFQTPNSAVNDSTNFGNISLYSNVGSMSWGTMGVQVISEPVISIVDVDSDIGFYRLKYQVGRTSEDGTEEYYNVSEYYRTRMYGEHQFILSYERHADQIFVPSALSVGNKSVLVGIESSSDIQTMTNAEGNRNVFVADKAIWFMDTDTKTLQKVFSFETSPTDLRQNYDQHDIKLLKITDNGDFQFLVYGYMNRGMHEGQAGIGLYTYYSDRNEVRENIFIPSYLPYQVLKNSIGSLCYLNNSGILYIMLDEFVYALDSNNNRASLYVSGLNEDNYKVSVNGRMLAWQEDGLSNTADVINVADLESERVYHVNATPGRNIKVLGFLENDLVYGEGDAGFIYTAENGKEYLMMNDLYVVNGNNVIQTTEHSNGGYYVTSLVEHNRVVINRVARVGNEFKKGDEFTLFSTEMVDYPTPHLYTTYDENRRTIYFIEVVKNMEPNRQVTINDTMKITLSSAEATDVGDMLSDSGKYYVYAGGEIMDILTNPADAIMSAYYATGVAVTDNGYFYRRSSRPITVELTEASIQNAIDAYNNETALNITGVYLRQAMYYTGRKIPVIWEWNDDVYVITGYDLYDNLMLRNIRTGEETLVAYDDVDQVFDIAGRCFILMP